MTTASLCVFVFLLGLVSLSHSCRFKKLNIKLEEGKIIFPKGCVDDDGNDRAYGESWKKDCNVFQCIQLVGILCMTEIPSPRTLTIPAHREMLVDKKTCSLKLVEKANNSNECNMFYMFSKH